MKYKSQNYLPAILLFIVCAASSKMFAVAADQTVSWVGYYGVK